MHVIAGTARGQALKIPARSGLRPTSSRVKEAAFNILAARVPGARWLDLFAGSGGVGIEALSRGADFCVFVEKDPLTCRVIRTNLQLARVGDRARVLAADVFAALRQLDRLGYAAELVYIDPPYGYQLLPRLLRQLAGSHVLMPEAVVLLETGKRDGLPVLEEWVVGRKYEYGDSRLIWLQEKDEGGGGSG